MANVGRSARWNRTVLATVLTAGIVAPLFGGVASAAPRTTPAPASSGYRHGTVATVAAAAAAAAGKAKSAAPSAAVASPNLSYGGGNGGVGVTTGPPKVYLVFWGSQWGSSSTNAQGYLTLSGDPSGMAPKLQAFMKGLGTGGETWSGVMTEYCEGVTAGVQTCPGNAAHVGYPTGGALAGMWADTSVAAPASANGHQLAVEAVSAATHFGNTTQASNRNSQYFVVSPPGTTPDGFNLPDSNFCAWHDVSADSGLPGGAASGPAVAFTNLPYLTDAGGSCGKNFVNSGTAGALDGVTIVGGHEYAETITDQFPPGGWLDSAGDENGDKCSWIQSGQGASQDITLTTGSFAVQTTWANDFNGGSGGCLVSHAVVGTPVNSAPAITSANGAAFTTGAAGSFTVMTTGWPTPTLGATGALPSGVTFADNHDGSATLAGVAAAGKGGSYPLVVTAANGVGNNATQNLTLTIREAPAITSANSATFTVGVAGSLNVTTTGFPSPGVTAAGTLPAGVTFNAATRTLGGIPAQGSAGSFPVTINAANGIGAPATQSFVLTVNQATFTYPIDGQSNVDTTQPMAWSTIPQASAYLLQVGTTLYGSDLVNSGILPPTQSSFNGPALPTGRTLHATLYARVAGSWTSYQAINFSAAPGQATFTSHATGQAGVDPTKPFTWSTIPQAQGYILVVGTTLNGSNLANSGVLPATQSTYTPPTLPAGRTVYASLLTEVNGAWTRFQSISFSTGPAMGTLTKPINGQLNVATPAVFTWRTIAGAQAYCLIVGSTLYGSDLVNSGVLAPTQSSFSVPALPHDRLLYGTLLTLVNGTWVFQVVGFTS
ncbi:MAG: hypothetical protein QOF30_1529 [Acidimicrobiaceae bacterium]|nr:hypothetical protein [Acidimicrobiaceae bacterium]